MPKRPHLLFKNPSDGNTTFRYSNRDMSEVDAPKNDVKTPEYYAPMIESLSRSLNNYQEQKARRRNERNPQIETPTEITCIEIEFQGRFDAANFERFYRETFGLAPLRYRNFHKTVLFVVTVDAQFNEFTTNVRRFIASADHNQPNYHTSVRFLKSFEFLSTEKIIEIKDQSRVVYLSLVDDIEIYKSQVEPLVGSLRRYLADRNISNNYNELNNTIEIVDISGETILDIARNFDVVQSITSSNAGIRIRPSSLGVPVREYNFQITNANVELPIIGVIDTGVSNQTPLAPLLVNVGTDFDYTGNDCQLDDADHGTGVASLAALGDRLSGIVSANLEADARILSIKVLDG